MKPDLVYIYSDIGLFDDELKYSLRSLKYIKDQYRNVVIVGDKPDWIKNIIHIKAKDKYSNKQCNAISKLAKACRNKKVSNTFILMNDDFIFLVPQKIEIYHKKKLSDLASHYGRGQYYHSIKNSRKALKDLTRRTTFKNYELHYPFIYNKNKFLKLFSQINWKHIPTIHRSVYGNYYMVPGKELIKDFKVYADTYQNGITDQKFISTDNQLMLNKKFKRLLKQKFPFKSKYECNILKKIYLFITWRGR